MVALITNFSFAYKHHRGYNQILHNINLRIKKGEILGLVGESGCGKSTLAYNLLGYKTFNGRVLNGSVQVDGHSLMTLERRNLDNLRGTVVSLVPQDPTTALSPHLRVGRQIEETMQKHDFVSNSKEARQRTVELFQMVKLPSPEKLINRYPHELSGGQQQRVVIAMAISCNPQLLVLDEPTTGLDVTTEVKIIELLSELRTTINISMLYVTHNLGVLRNIADRVCVMYAGHIVEIADTIKLFEKRMHPYTKGLISSMPCLETGINDGNRLKGLLRRNELPPGGCPFSPRCNYTTEPCINELQVLKKIDADHEVACWKWDNISIAETNRQSNECKDDTFIDNNRDAKLLEVREISISYHHSSILDKLFKRNIAPIVTNIDFSISTGKTMALVGESGSGKTTIAKAICGLLEPIEGVIKFNGKPLPTQVKNRTKELKRKIQYIFQNPDASLNPRKRIASILSRPLTIFYNLNPKKVNIKIKKNLLDVGLPRSYTRRYPQELSGGERQRVAIARALSVSPQLLLCDEILSALDVSVQANIIDMLHGLKMETEVAMLFISHDLAVVRTLADSVGVLYHGRMMEIGNVEEIFSAPFHPYTHVLLMAASHNTNKIKKIDSNGEPLNHPSNASGCVFAGRCPWKVGEICNNSPPPLRTVGKSLQLWCHQPLEELYKRASWKAKI